MVVKLQRPNIRDTIERDIDLLYWLARAIERSVPESRVYSPTRLVAEFDRAITAELDFTLEADNAERFARNFRDFDPGIVTYPTVYRQASSKRVLTLEFFDGKKVLDAVAAGADGEKIAKHAVAVMVKQIYEDGFFHADPHPGNIIIQGTAGRSADRFHRSRSGRSAHATPARQDRRPDGGRRQRRSPRAGRRALRDRHAHEEDRSARVRGRGGACWPTSTWASRSRTSSCPG